MEFVTIRVFDSGVEAHVLKNTLEFNGIKVFIKDEHIMSVHPISPAHGGFKVQVPKDQLEEAEKLIKMIDDGEFDLYKNIYLN